MIKNDNNNNNYKINYQSIAGSSSSSLKNGETLSVLFTGVGGQGIILATTVLANAAINAGYDVKVSEVHGMAQRGGSVEGSVRIGKKVFSPTINSADFIVALEKLEALRYARKLKEGGFMLVSDYSIYPSTVFSGDVSYPENAEEMLFKFTENFFFINAVEKAKNLGNTRVSNTIMVGALSLMMPFGQDCWLDAIKDSVPGKALQINIEAFKSGRDFLK
ncbi:MAG: indolepyruvate oxidoreductase subunit beta [Actinobacteria bacterium]|nr:indolepyruvate oxidoreductase subunit beta [Actinomycetota bacterium]